MPHRSARKKSAGRNQSSVGRGVRCKSVIAHGRRSERRLVVCPRLTALLTLLMGFHGGVYRASANQVTPTLPLLDLSSPFNDSSAIGVFDGIKFYISSFTHTLNGKLVRTLAGWEKNLLLLRKEEGQVRPRLFLRSSNRSDSCFPAWNNIRRIVDPS